MKNCYITNFVKMYFSLVDEAVKTIFQKRYKDDIAFEEIGLYFDCKRQAIENRIKNHKKNMKKLLEGQKYKNIYANENIMKVRAEILNVIADEKYLANVKLIEKCDVEYDINNYLVKIFFDCLNIKKYKIEDNYIFSLEKMNIKFIIKIYNEICKMLNEHVLGIDRFGLITNIKKIFKGKNIDNNLITSICDLSSNIKYIDDKYYLEFNCLTSYDRKAIRILSENNKEMYGKQVASIIFEKDGSSFNEEKAKAVINAMIKHDSIVPVGKTGLWVLNTFQYQSDYHVDLIKKCFLNMNKPLTSNEVYTQIIRKYRRNDLDLVKIQSYLHINKKEFIPIDKNLFIINLWSKKYSDKIKKYKRLKNANRNFNIILCSILVNGKELSLKKIVTELKKNDITLSEGRIREKIKNLEFVDRHKHKNSYLYSIIKDNSLVQNEFINSVLRCIREVKNGIENRGADFTLKHNNEPISEPRAQVVLYEMSRGYFKAADIDINREIYTGRGPVDFKFSVGYKLQTIMELKLAGNGKLYDGLEAQLIQYMGSQCIRNGIFIVVIFSDEEFNNISQIEEKIEQIKYKYGIQIYFEFIDARGGKKYPSQLKKGEEDVIVDLLN